MLPDASNWRTGALPATEPRLSSCSSEVGRPSLPRPAQDVGVSGLIQQAARLKAHNRHDKMHIQLLWPWDHSRHTDQGISTAGRSSHVCQQLPCTMVKWTRCSNKSALRCAVTAVLPFVPCVSCLHPVQVALTLSIPFHPSHLQVASLSARFGCLLVLHQS